MSGEAVTAPAWREARQASGARIDSRGPADGIVPPAGHPRSEGAVGPLVVDEAAMQASGAEPARLTAVGTSRWSGRGATESLVNRR